MCVGFAAHLILQKGGQTVCFSIHQLISGGFVDQFSVGFMFRKPYNQAVNTIHTGSMIAASRVDKITSRPVNNAFNWYCSVIA